MGHGFDAVGRMCPLPRSLAAEANGCFMVRTPCGSNRIQGCGARFARHGRLPSVCLLAASPKATALQCVTVTEIRGMPRGRNPDGEHALSNAERQARYRARHLMQPAPVTTRTRRPIDRRSRPHRWRDAVIELLALQAEYADWFTALPDSLRDSSTANALEAIVDLDLTTLADSEPPRGYGRD